MIRNYSLVKNEYLLAKIKDFLIFLFLFFTMFFPVTYSIFRLGFFLISIILILYTKNFKITGGCVKEIIVFVMMNSISFFIGLANKTPGAIRCLTVEVVWPILFLLFSQEIKSDYELKKIEKQILYIYLIVLLFDTMFLFSNLLNIKMIPIFMLNALECKFGAYGSFFQYTTTHMCTLIFMTPLIISAFFEQNDKEIVSMPVLILELLLSFFCMAMSGRVAYILVTLVSTIAIILIKIIIPSKNCMDKHEKKTKIIIISSVIVIMFIVLKVGTGLKFESVINYVIEKFHTSTQSSHIDNGVRDIQAKALIKGWLEKPIFGHGTGSYTPECIRSDTMLWAYEYTYLAMLFQKGIFGVLVYFGFVIIIFVKAVKSVKYGIYSRNAVVPFLIGLFAILIATAADPYLTTFGCMWMLYIPFAIANFDVKGNNNV